MGSQLKADLRLAPEALPFVVELLLTNDAELVLTASLALQYNGGHIESDATEDRDPTYYRVTFPDGTVHTQEISA
jgi:hypothetical protein